MRVALLGAGRIGAVHAQNISDNPASELVSISDINADAAGSLAAKYGAAVRDVDHVMSDASIDAILVASSTDTHADLIEAGIGSGKAVFCEKPIDLDLERSIRCWRKVNGKGTPVVLGFNRRFDPNFGALKRAFDAGEIGKGELLTLTSFDPAPPPIGYVKISGGLFRDMAIHDFDLACWIFGARPTHVSATGSCLVDDEIGAEGDIDTAVCVLKFADGRIATIKNSRRAVYGYDQRIELLGEKGMLSVGNELESAVTRVTEAGASAAKPRYFFLERYMAAYRAEWSHFVDVVATGAAPEATIADGVTALAIAEAAETALKTGAVTQVAYPSAAEAVQ